MRLRPQVSLVTAFVLVLLVGAAATLRRETIATGVDVRSADAATPPRAAAWSAAMSRLDVAIARADRSAVLSEWRAAYTTGLASRNWEPMIALGDAAQRIAVLDRQREPFEPEARAAYLQALQAARRAQSSDGLVAVAEGLESLGHFEMAHQVRRLAERLRGEAAEP